MTTSIRSRDWLRLDPAPVPSWRVWTTSFLILVVTSALVILLKPVLDGEVSSGLLFVLGITLVGATAGLAPALVCALMAAVFFNFFLAKPVLTFRMSTGEDLAPPIIFTLCAVIPGVLSGRLKDQSSRANNSNLRLEGLLETSRNLQRATSEIEIYDALRSVLSDKLGIDLALYQLAGDRIYPVGASAAEPEWMRLAARVSAGNADCLRAGGLTGYLLSGSRSSVGVIVGDRIDEATGDDNFMLALARIAGLALERAQLASRVVEAQALARTEELKSALLSSVSHDLRTPLTAISTSASSLLTFGDRFDRATSHQLLKGIVEECNRLNHLTSNLLEISRIEGGVDNIKGAILSVSEMARKAIARQKRFAGDRKIGFNGPDRDILVEVDIALFELALTNILQNALQYSAADGEVSVTCIEVEGCCEIAVTDDGVGIPQEDQVRVFDKFYRVARNSGASKGSGLGLAIAKGFVEASNGSIAIQSPARGGRGTTVTIRLPLASEVEAW